jgi:peptidoglycan hydrolase-like protein with peptidoglycan-binding domain
MAHRRPSITLAAMIFVIGACGGPVTTDATVRTTVAPATTTTTASSTTLSDHLGPLGVLLDDPVEDPFFRTGFHAMTWGDDLHSHVVSIDPLEGADPETNRLGVGPLDPMPPTTGVTADQMLVEVWVDHATGDVAPTGVALYTLGAQGWGVYVAITSDAILAFLETTTDYGAKRPAGLPVVQTLLTQFDWAGGTAHFTADVVVGDALSSDSSPAYEGQVECTLAAALDCMVISDDGVLRPGDEGDAVQALQENLGILGYFAGPLDGLYDDETEGAVRLFQRDYRLGIDGKAGPQTLGLIDEVVAGTSTIVLASQAGVGDVGFGTAYDPALSALDHLFGSPDTATGWYDDACDGHHWYRATWGGFTAIFTDRSGTRQFDGWHVDDLSDLPSWMYFAGGVTPSWTWKDFEAMGAQWDSGYQVWYATDLGYNDGRFVDAPSGPPANRAVVKSFGTGTGAFGDC